VSDRELLELAAKAAGIRHIEYDNGYDGKLGLMLCDDVGRHTAAWNPLKDDGDALRLAVKLRITTSLASVVSSGDIYAQAPLVRPIFEPVGGDVLAATRRAIVRAAAEIGRAQS
jgi:hypothetical protein